jgi:hypothetical protein
MGSGWGGERRAGERGIRGGNRRHEINKKQLILTKGLDRLTEYIYHKLTSFTE